ncbi:hypothetical protein ACVR05_02820 [Streptococcus caprae]|uniref:Uncharacterized protein n=1 Tax=Streptococcus caprae TaxID=1640501 RepID=A0ABV8CYY9_9STRE
MTKNGTWRYVIHFKETLPDLSLPVFQEYITVERQLDDQVVVVHSTINDVMLQDLIVKECGLKKSAFAISGGLMRIPI